MRRLLALSLALTALLGCASTRTPAERAHAQVHFGWKAARAGLWHEAHFRFTEALKLAPGDAAIHNDLAVALEAMGDFPEAFAEYKKALELAPNDAHIRFNYSKFAEFYTSYTKKIGKAVDAH